MPAVQIWRAAAPSSGQSSLSAALARFAPHCCCAANECRKERLIRKAALQRLSGPFLIQDQDILARAVAKLDHVLRYSMVPFESQLHTARYVCGATGCVSRSQAGRHAAR
jgi:hypothetical protein